MRNGNIPTKQIQDTQKWMKLIAGRLPTRQATALRRYAGKQLSRLRRNNALGADRGKR